MTDTSTWQVEDWIRAIRNADSLEELLHMVGPTEDENEAAKRRLENMDKIWLRCKDQYGFNKSDWPWADRERYERLDREQAEFEAKYC